MWMCVSSFVCVCMWILREFDSCCMVADRYTAMMVRLPQCMSDKLDLLFFSFYLLRSKELIRARESVCPNSIYFCSLPREKMFLGT